MPGAASVPFGEKPVGVYLARVPTKDGGKGMRTAIVVILLVLLVGSFSASAQRLTGGLSVELTDLGEVAPGVKVVDGGTFDPTKNQFTGVSIGGRSGRSTRIQVDGVDITDETVGTTVMNLSNESIEEFGISQSSLDSSTDLTSTGAVNIISKSGTNTFHGSGFGFWRRSDFAANNGALDQLNPVKPVFSRDDYGGRLGGPIFKDKLFAFLSYERQKQAWSTYGFLPALEHVE